MDRIREQEIKQEVLRQLAEEKKESFKALAQNEDFLLLAADFLLWCAVLTANREKEICSVGFTEGKRAAGLWLLAALLEADDNALGRIRTLIKKEEMRKINLIESRIKAEKQ